MPNLLLDLKVFLESSPTSWHAAMQAGNRLASCDFIPLSEHEPWNLEWGKKYFVLRGGSICAWIMPEKKALRAQLTVSHTDSPALKLKPCPYIQQDNMGLFGVEIYGAPLLTSWLNRDLGLAGRVVILNDQGVQEERLVFLDDAPLFIPELAIHLNREVNEKGLLLNKQEHLRPLIGLMETDPLETLLRRHLSFKKLLSFDLFLVPLEPPRFIGHEGELLAAYRLDNLASVHASISAIAYVQKPPSDTLLVTVCYDHEEIGSHSNCGAGSAFLVDMFDRLKGKMGWTLEEYQLFKRSSTCVSIDMAHGVHPNHKDKHDPEHRPLLGKGIALKYNAQQRYATDALSAAPIIHACQQLNLPYQSFVNRSDMPCGSTIGPIIAEQLGILTVDIGIPELSMHASREVMATQDYLMLCHLLTHLNQGVTSGPL